MFRTSCALLLLSVATFTTGTASGETVEPCGSEELIFTNGIACDEPDCGRWFALGELTLFSYSRSPGVQVGDDPGDEVNFGLELAPRVTLGHINSDGFGARGRYFTYDHSANSADGDGAISVDTDIVDFELFQVWNLSRATSFEFAGGFRYQQFEEILDDDGEVSINQLDGVGGLLSGRLNRRVGWGNVYGQARVGMIRADKFILDDTDGPTVVNDTMLGTTELALGYEYACRCGCGVLSANFGAEWQRWMNYTEGHDVAADNSTDFRGGGGDAGLVGLVFGLGFGY